MFRGNNEAGCTGGPSFQRPDRDCEDDDENEGDYGPETPWPRIDVLNRTEDCFKKVWDNCRGESRIY